MQDLKSFNSRSAGKIHSLMEADVTRGESFNSRSAGKIHIQNPAYTFPVLAFQFPQCG